MPRLTVNYPRQTTWRSFSDRLVKYYRLPHGSRLDLVYTRHPKFPDGRKVRDDMQVRRRPIKRAEHPIPTNGAIRISEILDRIRSMLALNLRAKHIDVVAVGPRGVRLDPRKLLTTWRQLDPEPTQEERDAEALRQEEIDLMLRPQVRSSILEFEEGLSDPERKVPQAVLVELVQRFGTTEVRDALQELRLV